MKESKIRVLLIDDDVTLGQMYVIGLQYLGFEVHYLSSFIAVTSTINEFQPNIMVLDVEVGAKNGIDESNAIFSHFPELPIIFISSHVESDYVKRAIKQGGASYLKKPFDIEELGVYIDRFAQHTLSTIGFGDFTYEIRSNTLCNIKTNTTQKLSSKEGIVLTLLVKNIDTTLSRAEIEQSLGDNATTEFITNNIISRLRKYIAEDTTLSIKTVNKIGYRLDSNI